MAFLSRFKQSFATFFAFIADSVAELKKVRWPKRRELISYTLVVLATVAFVTVYFWLLDMGITGLLRLVFE